MIYIEKLLNLGQQAIEGEDYLVLLRIYSDKFVIKQCFLESSPILKTPDIDDEISFEADVPDILLNYNKSATKTLKEIYNIVSTETAGEISNDVIQVFTASIKKFNKILKSPVNPVNLTIESDLEFKTTLNIDLNEITIEKRFTDKDIKTFKQIIPLESVLASYNESVTDFFLDVFNKLEPEFLDSFKAYAQKLY